MASRLRKEEREWFRNNELRRRLRHHWFSREIQKSGEHPIRYACALTTLLMLSIVLGYVLPKDWFIGYWSTWKDPEQLSYFTSLWTIQATIVALVYPFIISFVTVLLGRRPTSKAFLQIYLIDSGGLVAGLSSFFLVLSMAVQYVMLSFYSLGWVVTWVAVDSVWFVYNIVLTIWFLYRTVEFLQSDFQMEVVKRYAINVALPREIANLMRFQLFANAQKNGWIPGPEYLDEKAEGQPQVLMRSYGLREGKVAVERNIRERSQLTNVFYWPLHLAVAGWLKTARKQQPPKAAGIFDNKPQPPLLIFPLLPGGLYDKTIVLARVVGGAELSLWQRMLVRLSFKFTAPRRLERRHVTLNEIFSEIETDARVTAGNGDVAAFEEAYGRVTDMHKALLGASLSPADDGSVGSWALVPDPFRFDRTLHEQWTNTYRPLFDAAASLLPRETRPIRRLCHVVQHLDCPELQRSPIEIRDRILIIPVLLMYSLGNWWSQRLEEQGVMQHGSNEMALLRPPLQGAYEETLVHFVGGWSSAREVLAYFRKRDDKFEWETAKDLVELNVTHINQTCLMLLRAVARGDQAAAEWLADMISKWWAHASSYDHEPFVLHGKSSFITIEAIAQEWNIVEQSLGLDDSDRQFIGQDYSGLQRHVCLAALRNYWRDVRILTVEILISWAAREGAQLGERSLAIYLLAGMLTGRKWRAGGQTKEPLNELSASSYLTAKARQYGADSSYRQGYVARLDRFVESAKDILRPDMVPGRVYSYSGADDVESLQEAQLIMFVILSAVDRQTGQSFRRQLAVWTSSNFQSTEIVKRRFEAMKRRLGEIGDEWYPNLVDRLLSLTEKLHTRPEGIARTRAALDILLKDIADLQTDAIINAQISPQRLRDIEEAASAEGFAAETGSFPLSIFSSVEYVDASQESFTLVISQLRKGELTDVEMADRAVNESEHYSETVANRVGALLLSDVIHQNEVREVLATTAAAYWSALKEGAKIIVDAGLTPVLILDNPTRPDWVWEWEHPTQDSVYPRPPDLVIRRAKERRGPGYITDFNEIQVFSGPVPVGASILLARESFARVTFRKYRDNVFVKATTEEVGEARTLVNLSLTFERAIHLGYNHLFRIRYNIESPAQNRDT